jgi:two-component system sensor histidine kinase UhpB
LQEILTNITRHARASKVELRIVKSKQHFSLKISDDGVGFKVDDKFNSHSLGLLGMQERALSIGGKIKIDSKVGKGTTVIFSLDCRDLN